MKKTILTSCMLFFSVCAIYAQLINQGFETWSTDALAPTAMNPNTGNTSTGWWTYNMYNYSVLGSSPLSVFRSDTAHSGSYSARIKSVVYTPTSHGYNAPWGLSFIGHNYLDTLGILFNGTTNETGGTYKPGIPFTQKIGSLSFWYLYAPQGVDTAECRALLVTNRVAQGGGLVKITNVTSGTWQQATIPFSYVASLTPDTLYILFSSSSLDRKPQPGSVFLVDDVSVNLLMGVNELSDENKMTVFPNPSTGMIELGTEGLDIKELAVYNISGQLIYQRSLSDFQTATSGNFQSQNRPITIDLSEQSAGLYFLQLKTGQGMVSKKIILSK